MRNITTVLCAALALMGVCRVRSYGAIGSPLMRKAKDWWLEKARGGVLRLTEGNPNAGMTVVIR